MEKLTQSQIIDSINDKVIAGLTTKGLQWFKPFKDSATNSFRAISASGRPYGGWNQFILSSTALEKGWVNKWYTFDAVNKAGGLIKKGEKATQIFAWQMSYKVEIAGKLKFFKRLEDIPENLRNVAEKSFFLKAWLVWSVSQTNIPTETIIPESVEELESHEYAERILKGWGAVVPIKSSGMGRAYYSPAEDYIHMPSKTSEQWQSAGDFYKVFFHEAVHSTGHKSRLNRLEKIASFGSDTYSKEELVAELGALYLEAITGIECMVDDFKNSQAYINGWIKAIKDDKNLIMQASSKSQEAVNLILSKV